VAVGNSGGAVVVDGVTVSPVTTGTTSHLLDITFATPSIVIAVGTAGVIVRSSDSGQTWNLVPIDGTQTALVAVGFATADIGFVAGEDGNLRRTGDGGLTWLHSFHKDASAFYSINFLDGDHGMAVGKDGLVIATDNGGVTWENIDSPTTRTLNAVRMVGVHNAFISGFDRLLLGYSLQPVPTLITSFDAQPNPFSVDLSWAVRDEANLSEFRIERSDGLAGRTFRDIAGTSRSFRDNSVVSGSTYEYTLVALDNDGATTYSAPIRVTTSKVELALLPNVPNPFNPSTTVRYILPAREIARVTIYDVSGRLVTTLVNREEAAGSYEVVWNGTDDAGSHVASGVYLARIEAGKQSLSRKMVLLK
jgi:hypothetical protein